MKIAHQDLIDGRQLKAGRAILGMSVREMAEAAGINRNSVLRVEAHTTLPHFAWAAKQIENVLQERGIRFLAGEGELGIYFEAPCKRKPTPYAKPMTKA